MLILFCSLLYGFQLFAERWVFHTALWRAKQGQWWCWSWSVLVCFWILVSVTVLVFCLDVNWSLAFLLFSVSVMIGRECSVQFQEGNTHLIYQATFVSYILKFSYQAECLASCNGAFCDPITLYCHCKTLVTLKGKKTVHVHWICQDCICCFWVGILNCKALSSWWWLPSTWITTTSISHLSHSAYWF